MAQCTFTIVHKDGPKQYIFNFWCQCVQRSLLSHLFTDSKHILEVKSECITISLALFKFWLKSQLLKEDIEDKDSEYEMLRLWVNQKLSPSYQLYNFTDNLLSGKCIAGLVNSIRPGVYFNLFFIARVHDWFISRVGFLRKP
jgi:hypothetical protein